MTTIETIVAVFSSSLLAAGLTSFVNYRLTTVNYRNEYYKKLLDRRLDAYENVYNFLSHLKMLTHDKEENTLTPFLLFNGINELDKTTIQILIPMKTNIWISDDLQDALGRLNVLLVELRYAAENAPDPDKELIRIGSNRLPDIREKRKEIERIMKLDLRTMHNIGSFLS